MHQLDARVPAGALAAALRADDPGIRLLATTGLAHYQRPDALPALRLAVADPDPRVRVAAVRGLAHHPSSTPLERERTVLAALAAEPPGPTRATLLAALAPALAAAPDWLLAASRDPQADCPGLELLARTGRDLRTAPDRAARAMVPGRSPAFCLRALDAAATTGWQPTGEAFAALTPLLESPQPATRVAAAGTLMGTPAFPWAEALTHSDPALRLSAARRASAPSSRVGTELRLAAVRHLLVEFADQPARFAQPHLHALLALLEGLRPHATESTVGAAAAAALTSLERARPSVPSGGWALAHCAAAELLDTSRAWPARVRGCASDMISKDFELAAEVRVLATSSDSHDLRLALLRKHFVDGHATVQREVVRAASTLPQPMRAQLLTLALRHDDPEVVGEALIALAQAGRPSGPELAALTDAAKVAKDEPGVARAWLGVARLIDPLPSFVNTLCEHPSPDIRRLACDILEDRGLPSPAAPPISVQGMSAARIPPPSATFTVNIKTSAGTVAFQLDAATAPVAAVRVVELVRAGHYDGRPTAFVRPGQVVAFGSAARPAGGWLRHEGTGEGLRRGDVALLDHARDAVSGQLLVALEDRPELAGQITRVGSVVAGLDVLDALTEADQTLEARVRAR